MTVLGRSPHSPLDVSGTSALPPQWQELAQRLNVEQFVRTHISWVMLGPEDVYKLKRPLDLGFVDFRALGRRRAACEAEVLLNRRLSDDVYVGVQPVTQDSSGKLELGGTGEVVDWVVHMKRLDDGDRADIRLQEGRLTGTEIDRIAGRLARFHHEIGTDDYAAWFGKPEVIARNIRENFAQTRASITHFISVAEQEEIERHQLGFLAQHEDLLMARIEERRVREGHGDLRLEHIYVPSGEPLQIIDCIEFNERFRYGDVASDLAFLVMDLSAHDRVDLAEHLAGSYAQQSGDYGVFDVLDFYEGYRAYVRGKIAALNANDPTLVQAQRDGYAALARRHFLLALASARRPLFTPMVVAVGGLIATGKSTVSRTLSGLVSAPIVEADRTRKQMLGINPTQPVHDGAWGGAYDPTFTDQVYREVMRRAAKVLDSGRSVVIDASFRSHALRHRARDLATARGIEFRFVECQAPASVCKQRLRERAKQASVSDGRIEIFNDFAARWEPVDELDDRHHFQLDTTAPRTEQTRTLGRVVEPCASLAGRSPRQREPAAPRSTVE